MTKFELFLATVTLSLLFIVGAVPVAKNILRKGNGTMELECRFGNFCDHLSATPLEWLYTCESYNMKVMIDGVKVLSFYGEHNETMTNDDVLVFSNMFTKSSYLPNGIGKLFQRLERFYVVSSRVKFIRRRNFIGLKHLKSLDLRYNEIQSIPEDAFVDLFNLEVLTISGNLIKKLPTNALVSMMNLRYFDASDNEIKAFDDEIFSQNLALQEILLENNQIKGINANFLKLNDIGFIDLRDNVCINSFYLRDYPDYPSISEFQAEININCTAPGTMIQQPAGTRSERSVLQWDICPRLLLPMNMLCLVERKFMQKTRK